MGERLFPALYLNMAGEMMYILEQRLRVQKENLEDREKSDKVLKEIIIAILAKSTLDEVFRASGLPQKKSLKLLFERLAHVSIMRLNDNSMDKLFDLMTMSTKYAFQQITMPEQILTVTVNHLQGLQDILPLDKSVREAVEHAYTMVFSLYRALTPFNWYMIRCGLLVFFQVSKVKISMLLREQRQLPDGNFILFMPGEPIQLPKEGETVGHTKYFDNGNISHSVEFPTTHTYTPFVSFPDSLNVPERSTKLGVNMYKNADSLKIHGGGGTAQVEQFQEGNEMAFFESIMSTTTNTIEGSDILGMSLFDNEKEENTYVKESEDMNIQRIDAAAKKISLKSAVEEKIKSRPTTADKDKKKKSKGASVLDMMDEAAARPPTAKSKTRRSESTGSTASASTTTRPRSKSGARTGGSERVPSAGPKRAASAKRKTEK